MNPEKKAKATADIYYEAWMLHRAFSECWKNETKAATTWQRNCILESTLLHTRSLLDFFQRDRTGSNVAKPDDVLAVDYDFQPKSFPFYSDLSSRINKRIAHLTYARGDVRDCDCLWNFPAFIPPILIQCRDFFKHLLASGQPMVTWPGKDAIKVLIEEINHDNT